MADILNRLNQLHKAKPRLDRWADMHFKLGDKPAYVLSIQLRTKIQYNPYAKLKNCRYRLKHIHYATEIHWEYGEDLLKDLQSEQWVNCRIKWADGEGYFDIFPIVGRKKLMAGLLTDQSLREMPIELLELIISYVV